MVKINLSERAWQRAALDYYSIERPSSQDMTSWLQDRYSIVKSRVDLRYDSCLVDVTFDDPKLAVEFILKYS